MKRILSMMLVVMMIAMSFTCIAFAEETTTVSISSANAKNSAESTIELTVTFSGANLKSGGLKNFKVLDAEQQEADKLAITDYETWTLPGDPALKTAANGTYAFAYSANQDDMTVSFKITVTVGEGAEAGEYTVTCDPSFKTKGSSGEVATTVDFTEGKITVLEAAEITAVKAVDEISKPMLTSKEDIIAELPTEVEITAPEKIAGQKVAVSAWTCADYNSKSAEEQTFVGTLAPVDPITAAAGLTATATVKLTQLTTATPVAADAINLTVKKNATADADTLKGMILDAYKEVSLDAGVDTIALTKDMITLSGDLDTTATGNSVTATITVPAGTESADGIYKLAADMDLAVAITITVKASGGYTPSGIGTPIGGTTNSGTTTPSDDTNDDDATTTPDDDTKDDATTPDDDKKDDDTNNTPVATEFGDVPADYWAFDFITTLKDMGIINGKDNGNFEPDAQLTRAEFAKMIAVAFGLTATSGDSKFADCTADDWYTEFVNAVAEAGYVNGKDDDTFGANDPISRQEICTILGRILGVEDAGELNFADADSIAEWAQAAVAALVEMGVVNGYEDGTFNGAANATRAEVAKMLVTFLTAIAAE